MAERELVDDAVIVTGASRGIGATTAKLLAERGADVSICSRDRDDVTAVETEINESDRPGRALAVECDVTDPDDVAAFVDATVEAFGTVDGLVNNVGDSVGDGMIHEIDAEVWDRNLEINLKGTFLLSREVVPIMAEQGGGSIVHTSAVNGATGIGYTAYSTAKGGIIPFSKLLATQYGYHGIRSNVISPGTIATESRAERRSTVDDDSRNELLDQYPLGRFGSAIEVAELTSFLLSDRASFITGTHIPVDGGLTAGLDHTFQDSYYGIEELPSLD
jgi:3-oxoacyl-[acyl-carrier protein] reductase